MFASLPASGTFTIAASTTLATTSAQTRQASRQIMATIENSIQR